MSKDYNDNIVIIEKPDSVSYEQIQALLNSAHGSNREKGLEYGVADQSVEELEREMSKNSVCYVAMDGDKLAGTRTMQFRTKKFLFIKLKMLYFQLFAVSPDYKGRHLGDRLFDFCMEKADEMGYKYISGNSAEDNQIICHMYLKRGFVKAYYTKYPRNNFFSVGYMRTPYKLVNRILALRYERMRKKVRAKHNLDD